MKVAVNTHRAQQHWLSVLSERLMARGHDVGLSRDTPPRDSNDGRGAVLRGLLRLEHTRAGSHRIWLVDDARGPTTGALPTHHVSRDEADLCLELGNAPEALDGSVRTLVATFDGRAGMAALWHALLEGRAPLLGVRDSASDRTIPLALPALEAPHRLLESAEAVLTHLIAALVRAIDDIADGREIRSTAGAPGPAGGEMPVGPGRRAPGTAGFMARRVATKAAEMREVLSGQAPTWQVAYRTASARMLAGDRLAGDAFTLLPDDGQRFYADPFIIVDEGWHHVFIEEFPYATRRGVISHFVIDRDGKASQPRVVLEEPHHLSYPQVFAHGGQMWMMPEASEAGRLDLYRAERFPDRWVHHARLIDAPVHDATLFAHDKRLWILAGTTLPGASSWDTLCLYHADRLEGPWQPHALNPVLIDARAARPAGGIFMHDGRLWRPAQDCSRGYGGALSLCRIDTLDPERFAQTVVSTLHFGNAADARGPHTLNFAGGIEIMDVFLPRPR